MRPPAWSLFNRCQLRPCPLGIDDELERVELLVARPEILEGPPAELGQILVRGMAQQRELRKLEREHIVATVDQRPRAPCERLRAAVAKQVERRRPFGRREDLEAYGLSYREVGRPCQLTNSSSSRQPFLLDLSAAEMNNTEIARLVHTGSPRVRPRVRGYACWVFGAPSPSRLAIGGNTGVGVRLCQKHFDELNAGLEFPRGVVVADYLWSTTTTRTAKFFDLVRYYWRDHLRWRAQGGRKPRHPGVISALWSPR